MKTALYVVKLVVWGLLAIVAGIVVGIMDSSYVNHYVNNTLLIAIAAFAFGLILGRVLGYIEGALDAGEASRFVPVVAPELLERAGDGDDNALKVVFPLESKPSHRALSRLADDGGIVHDDD